MQYIIRGNFIDTPTMDKFRIRKGELLIEDEKIKGFKESFNRNDIEIIDYQDKLIIPGLADLHLHAAQFNYCGTAMDETLLDWLNRYTFPEESKYQDLDYAKRSYKHFVNELAKTPTTRCCMFASIHTDASLALMDYLEEYKMCCYVGKVQMDRNSPDYYIEKNGKEETIRFIEEALKKNYKFAMPMITPRFTPTVSDDYMSFLGNVAKKYNLACQSHLSENVGEVEWVKELRPNDNFYGESYDKAGLFGKDIKTVMAHCSLSGEEENKLIKENGVYIAHCPTSNVNIVTAICPSAMYLRNGYKIGLGSDISGGNTLNMFEVMKSAIQMSKARFYNVDNTIKPLTITEVYYMATNIGGSFFGNVGLFNEGYEFDAVVLEDFEDLEIRKHTITERLERLIYLNNYNMVAKYVKGYKIK